MKKRFSLLFLSITIALTGAMGILSLSASADAAPPAPPVGSNIPPEGLTNVRMVSETVTLDIGISTAQVQAVFYMHNLGEQAEEMLVRFPLYDDGYQMDSDECDFLVSGPPIQDFSVWVDGQRVEISKTWRTIQVWSYTEIVDREIPCWAHFSVRFPPAENVEILVRYTVEGFHADAASAYLYYPYVLETGAGWRDTIALAEITMRLPYEVTPMNLSQCSPDCLLSGKEIRWRFENLEPTGNHNIEAIILAPSVWQRIQRETRLLQANPNDGEAWGRLGKAYKEAILYRRSYRSDAAGLEMAALSEAAYEKAITLLPNDADWHYGYADWLCWKAEWDNHYNPSLEAWQACVEQLRQTLAINPRHVRGLELLNDLVLWQEGTSTYPRKQIYELVNLSGPEPDFLILTPQPSATATQLLLRASPRPTRTPPAPTLTATSRPASTATLMPRSTDAPTHASPTVTTTPIPAPADSPRSGLLAAGIVLLVLVIAGGVILRKRI